MSQSPAPFSDFDFTFDPSLSNIFPNPPPLPSSADLFSPSETTDLLGFLDNFSDFAWDFAGQPQEYDHSAPYDHASASVAPYSNPHLNTIPDTSTSSRPKPNTRSASTRGTQRLSDDRISDSIAPSDSPSATSPTYLSPIDSSSRSSASPSSTTTTTPTPTPSAQTQSQSQQQQNPPSSRAISNARSKPLLSTPQKRLNHIMSEQKRRNAIRDGYAQLIALLAPAGSAPGIGMPTRGRPKGSGSRGKGVSKGKSGVLFRAVEYCRWLEEARESLRNEVIRIEAAAGIRHPSP